MLLAGIAVLSIILGVAVITALPDPRRAGSRLLDATGLFLLTVGLLWGSTLLLPPVGNWILVALGLFAAAFLRARQSSAPSLLPLMVGFGLGSVVFHLTLAVVDISASTQVFASDLDLLAAALERAHSVGNISSFLVITILLLISAGGGHFLGLRLGRN